MPTNKKILVATVIIIVLVGVLAALAYSTRWQPLQRIFPAAVVRGSFISLQRWADSLAVADRFGSNFSRPAVYEQMIRAEQERQLAGSVDLRAEESYLTAGRANEYSETLSKYFNSQPGLFEKLVIAPRAYDAKLRIRYNSDFELNATAYEHARKILSDLKSGQDFGALAKTESDDKVTGQLGGDLGFVSLNQLLPEISDKLKSMSLGQVADKIFISRFGYHILYPIETAQKDGQTVYHIKQILIGTTGYDEWLSGMISKFSVWRIVKP